MWSERQLSSQGRKAVRDVPGLIYGGGWYILGVQTLACVVIIAWAVLTSFVTFKAIDVTIGLRISTVAEIIGADVCEHSINGEYDVSEGVIRAPGGETFQLHATYIRGQPVPDFGSGWKEQKLAKWTENMPGSWNVICLVGLVEARSVGIQNRRACFHPVRIDEDDTDCVSAVPSGPVLSKKDVLKIIDISLALRNKVARSAYGKTVGLHGRRPSTANISDEGKSLVIRRARRAADDVTEEARELPQTVMTSHRPSSGRHGRDNDAFDDAEGKFLKVPADVH
ncbi:Ammonium Transporter Family [Branchiostoma belcheri]|nr:Ammonium Transporter Family [Branchiostoma belcheri]